MFESQRIQLLGPFKGTGGCCSADTCSLLLSFRGRERKKDPSSGKTAHMVVTWRP